MGSSRFPGKMMADIAGKPTLDRVIQRLKQSKTLDGIVLATTSSDEDDVLEILAAQLEVPCYRGGSEEDVLERVVDAQKYMNSDVVVEICGDCPLLDPDILDQAVEIYKSNDVDLVSTSVVQSYPQGTEVQVFARSSLEEVMRSTGDPAHREHVSLYFYENSENYNIINMVAPPFLLGQNMRLQLDYLEDLKLIQHIYMALESPDFRTKDVIKFLDNHPQIAMINAWG